MTRNHISDEKFEKNENISFRSFNGRLKRMLIPKLRKGSVKSICCSLSAVIVKAATAKSA